MKIITEDAAKTIISKAGIPAESVEISAIADRLDNVALWLIQAQYLRREDKRGRPRRTMGPELRQELFRNLETGVWLDLPGVDKFAAHTYNNYKQDGQDKYTGPFVEYVKCFCGTVARYIKAERLDKVLTFAGLASALRSIEANGVHVRDGLELSGIKPLARSLVIQPANDD